MQYFNIIKKVGTILIIVILFSTQYTNAQSVFTLRYTELNFTRLSFIKKIEDNKLLLFLRTNNNYFTIAKADTVGNILFKKRFQCLASDDNDLVKSDSSYYFLSNTWDSSGNYGNAVIKINNQLDIIWARKYYYPSSTNQLNTICLTNNGGFMLIGDGCSGKNMIINCDLNGNIIWQKKLTITNQFLFYRSLRENSNSFLVCNGSLNDPISIYKIDTTGNIAYYKKFNSFYYCPISFIKSNDKGYTILGTTELNESNFKYLVHLDSNLNFIWGKQIEFQNKCCLKNLIQLDNGNYVFTGSNSIKTYANALCGSTDIDGNILWIKSYGYSIDSNAYINEFTSILNTNNNSFFLGGGTELLKINKNGIGFCKNNDELYFSSSVYSESNYFYPTTIPINFLTDIMFYNTFNDFNMTRLIVCEESLSNESKIDYITEIKIYPNPTLDEININYISVENLILDIYNSWGIKQRSFLLNKDSNSERFNLSELAAGIYFYSIYNTSLKKISSGKIILNK